MKRGRPIDARNCAPVRLAEWPPIAKRADMHAEFREASDIDTTLKFGDVIAFAPLSSTDA